MTTWRYALVGGCAALASLAACTSLVGDFGTGTDTEGSDAGPTTDGASGCTSTPCDAGPDSAGTDATTDTGTNSSPDATSDAPADVTAFDAADSALVCTEGGTQCGSSCTDLAGDNSNCGRCGRVCGAGSTCSSGLCTPVALCNFNIGVDSTPLYILGGISYTGLGQKVYSCPISPPGGTTTPIFSTALLQLSATDLAAGSQTIWFATANTQFSPPSRGLSEYFPSTQSVVSAGSFTSANYVATAVDPSTGILFQAYTDSIYAVAAVAPEPDAGQHSQLCQYGLDNVVEIAAGGGKLIVSDNQTGTITGSTVSANDVCDTAATLATGEPAVSALATNGTIFTFNDGTSVFACDATLGCLPSASPTPLAKSQGSVSAIAIDGASPPNLYWVGSQGLVSCSSSASACNDSPTTLIPNATPTAGIVVDDTYVYYTQNTTLYRVVH